MRLGEEKGRLYDRHRIKAASVIGIILPWLLLLVGIVTTILNLSSFSSEWECFTDGMIM